MVWVSCCPLTTGSGEPVLVSGRSAGGRRPRRRARVTLKAREIAASMGFDTLCTVYSARRAAAPLPPTVR